MPYDPNDPNQGSQAPGSEGNPYAGGSSGSVDALIRSRPAVQQWLSAHNDGKNLSPSDQQQLMSLIQQQGIDTKMLEYDGNTGTFNSGTGHTLRDIAYGSLMAFGPVLASWAIPAMMGTGGAAGTTGATAGAWPTGGVVAGVTSGVVDGVTSGAGGSGALGAIASPALDATGKINAIIGILAGLVSAAAGHAISGNAASANVPPQLSSLLDMAVQRQQYQNPLMQAKTQGTYAMLPSFARQGTNLTGSLPGAAGPAYQMPTGPSVPPMGTNDMGVDPQKIAALRSLFGGG